MEPAARGAGDLALGVTIHLEVAGVDWVREGVNLSGARVSLFDFLLGIWKTGNKGTIAILWGTLL